VAASLKPCGNCSRHVRASESACPFCGQRLQLSESVAEFRLLSRLDRNTMVALGAVLSAAGIVLGCRETAMAIYGAPPATPDQVQEPTAPPGSATPGELAPPEEPKPPAAPTASATPGVPPGAPAAAYGAPPSMGPAVAPMPPSAPAPTPGKPGK